MRDEERRAANIAAVKTHLKKEFPERTIDDWHDAKGDAHGFRIHEGGFPDVEVSHEFLDGEPASGTVLRDLSAEIRRTSRNMVVVVTRMAVFTRPRTK